MSWLDRFFSSRNYGTIQNAGVVMPPESILNFAGSGFSVADDPTNGRTTVTFSGGGGLDVEYVCTPEMFGAVGDGVTSDQTAFDNMLTAIAAGTYKSVQLSANKQYLITSTLTPSANTSFFGYGDNSIIKTASNIAIFTVTVEGCRFANFQLLGNFTGANQTGIRLGIPSTTNGPINCIINNVHFKSFAHSGITNVKNPLAVGVYQGPLVSNCLAELCTYGFYCAERGEFISFSNCEASQCTYGLWIACGNVNWIGGDISGNTTGIRVTSGTNDGHGQIIGVKVNHCTSKNIHCDNVTNGMIFDGITSYQGNITIDTCTGIVIQNSFLDLDTYTFTTAVGCRMWPNTYPNGYGNVATISTDSSIDWGPIGSSRLLNKQTPTFIGPEQHLYYTFPANSNQTLNARQSEAKIITINSDAFGSAVSLTIGRLPAKAEMVIVRNNKITPVTIQWSSGTGVIVMPSCQAIIGADGTNAIEIAQVFSLKNGTTLYGCSDSTFNAMCNTYRLHPAVDLYLGVGSTNVMYMDVNALQPIKPIIGLASPYGMNGVGTQAMGDANQTPTSSVYGNNTIKTTGLLTANRDLILPTSTDAAAYTKVINNACTGAFGVVVKCAAGTTVTVANGTSAVVLVDSRGVTRLTPDT